jgi:hypothetical protein
MEGKEGVVLLDSTYEDLSALYSGKEWWPAAAAVQKLLRGGEVSRAVSMLGIGPY